LNEIATLAHRSRQIVTVGYFNGDGISALITVFYGHAISLCQIPRSYVTMAHSVRFLPFILPNGNVIPIGFLL
jgi:hypothetical protein